MSGDSGVILHDIEKRIILTLQQSNAGKSTQEIIETTKLLPDQVRRGIEWLKHKGFVHVDETIKETIVLGENGKDAFENGLPERQLLRALTDEPISISELQHRLGTSHTFGAAMGIAKKNGWIEYQMADNTVTDQSTKTANNSSKSMVCISHKSPPPNTLPGETALHIMGSHDKVADVDPKEIDILSKRPGFIIKQKTITRTITLVDTTLDVSIETKGIDVEADVPTTFVARTHPLKDTIDEIREAFVALGFSEVTGNTIQPCFWNFDALFTPQDHPAREMQDTFYLDLDSSKNDIRDTTAEQIAAVAESHKKNWRYQWSLTDAQRWVLRTHTTCVTIKHLADTKPQEARIFSLGRVFRNEKPSYKHLVEFTQIEGVVASKNATLRDLMGIQQEFYKRMGITKIKFWPTFFPYTEPSLQTMVYNSRLNKWVELFGMGIFRPEVTEPLGIPVPVLAWGGGIERIAMLKYGLDDVRELYANNMGWLRRNRGNTTCQ